MEKAGFNHNYVTNALQAIKNWGLERLGMRLLGTTWCMLLSLAIQCMQCSLVYSFWLLASNCRKKSVSLGMRLTNVHTSPNPLNLLSTVSHCTLSGGAPTGAEFHKTPVAASVEQIRTSNEERRGKILILSSGHNSGINGSDTGIIGLYMLTRTRLAIRKVHDGNVEL